MKILHTMIRVEDLDRSIKFYEEVLNMRLLKRQDYPHGEFTLAFMGYQEISDGPVLELTYNWDKRKYDLGSGYGHIALSVTNIYEMCEKVENAGYVVSRAPGPMKGSSSILAFIDDPDGYKIELIERK